MALFVLLSEKYHVKCAYYHPHVDLEDHMYKTIVGEYWSLEQCVLFVSESQWIDKYVNAWKQEKAQSIVVQSTDHINKDWILDKPMCDCMVLTAKTFPDAYFWELYHKIPEKLTIISVVEDPCYHPLDDNLEGCISSDEMLLLEYLRNNDGNKVVVDLLKSTPCAQITLFYQNKQGLVDTPRKTLELMKQQDSSDDDDFEY